MATILVVNGPNLNLLGTREPDVYGTLSLETIKEQCQSVAQHYGHNLLFVQHNHEGALVDIIQHSVEQNIDIIIINPAAFTHTSIALRDAIKAVNIACIEVHISNIYNREAFRAHSYFSDIALGTISGLGPVGYELAIIAAHHYLTQSRN